MAIEDKGLSALYFSKEKKEVPLSHYKILRSHLISKSTFKDENRIDTIKPGTLLGFSKNGHWYFEDIKSYHLQEFLKEYKILYDGAVLIENLSIIRPKNIAEIAKISNTGKLCVGLENFSGFFNYRIDEWYFILRNEENDIFIDLSKEWQTFLKEFREINEVDHPLDI